MGIESALVLSGVIETLNQALSRLSSGMSKGKGCAMALLVRRSAALRCPGSSEPVDQVHRFVLAQALVFLWLVEGG